MPVHLARAVLHTRPTVTVLVYSCYATCHLENLALYVQPAQPHNKRLHLTKNRLTGIRIITYLNISCPTGFHELEFH